MAEPAFPEKRAVRRSFERAAQTYDRHSALQAEIGKRLLEHLEPMRLAPLTPFLLIASLAPTPLGACVLAAAEDGIDPALVALERLYRHSREHLDRLEHALSPHVPHVIVLRAGLRKKQRRALDERLAPYRRGHGSGPASRAARAPICSP